MLIDLIACIPFTLIEQQESNSDYNSLLRLLRLPRLYRMLRIARIFKLLKQYKQLQFIDKVQEFLSLKQSVTRLIRSFISILLFVHVMSCFWYLSARLDDFSPSTWVVRLGYQNSSVLSQYIASAY